MGKKKPIVVSLDQEQINWLESKIEEGYSKPGLVRYAIKRLMEEPIKTDPKEIEVKKEQAIQQDNSEIDDPAKKIDIEKLLDLLIEWGEAGKLNDSGMDIAEIMETAKMMKYRLANIDQLSPQMAFMLGQFKGEMELKVGHWIQKHNKG